MDGNKGEVLVYPMAWKKEQCSIDKADTLFNCCPVDVGEDLAEDLVLAAALSLFVVRVCTG
jgi:hypothetical protein